MGVIEAVEINQSERVYAFVICIGGSRPEKHNGP